MIQIPIIEAVTGLFSGLISAIDDWHTSDEEKLQAKGAIFMAQGQLLSTVFEYEKSLLQMQTDVIRAEAQGESWLQRSWRPMVMLAFVSAVLAYWFGLTPDTLTQESVDWMFRMLTVGLGGYVVGRSAEKVAKSINFNKTVETD